MEHWAAIVAGADRRSHAREIAEARDRLLGTGREPRVERRRGEPTVRPVIERSWKRSAAAGVDPDHGLAPVRAGEAEVSQRWDSHPLAIAVPILRGLLDDVGDTEHVALICDADGTLLWIDGRPAMLDAAREVHLERGSVWSEGAAGTNAMGTALAERHPIQVFSAEHFAETVHPWTCSAAPVRDPVTGQTIGVLDLTGALGTAHPHSLAVVTMAARLVERELTLAAERAGEQVAAVSLTVLGRDRGVLRIAGEEHVLSPRHTELLLLLLMREEGMTAEQLALEVWGERGRPGSVRSELHRLRPILGPLLGERPYRLTAAVACDVMRAERLVRAERVAEALAGYAGPLLPQSEVPRVAELRDRVDDQLRAAVLASGDPQLLETWLRTPTGRDDFEASRQLAVSLPRTDPRRAAERSRI
ncbi:MAG: GAF domain-containing protein, partial [Solirubrobacteraceae bacterium]|nr:GAF domain-containing protein [Solirubrobacteraceae bacterium]